MAGPRRHADRCQRPARLRDGAITKVDDHTVKLKLTAPDISIIPNFDRLSGADRAPRLRRERRRPHQATRSAPARSSWSPTTSARRWSTSAARTANGGAARRYLDGVEFIDYGTDPSATVSAFESGEVDANYRDLGRLRRRSSTGWAWSSRRSSPRPPSSPAPTSSNKPYDDQKVRNALQMAVDNAVVLQLGYGNAGHGRREPPCLPDPSRIFRAAEDSRATWPRPRS